MNIFVKKQPGRVLASDNDPFEEWSAWRIKFNEQLINQMQGKKQDFDMPAPKAEFLMEYGVSSDQTSTYQTSLAPDLFVCYGIPRARVNFDHKTRQLYK